MSNSVSFPIRREAPIAACDCGLANAVEFLSDKWTMLILREAFYGVVRFDDIRTDIDIPKATLADRLKKLTEKDLLYKKPYREEGQRARAAYFLTNKGRTLSLPLLALMQWGDDHLLEGDPLAKLMANDRKGEVRIGFVDSNGKAVPPSKIKFITPSEEDNQS